MLNNVNRMLLLMLQLSTKLTEMRLKTTEEEALSKYEGTKKDNENRKRVKLKLT